jgi:Mg-chelatase subunit ChlD
VSARQSIAEARGVLGKIGAPLYKGILRAAIERAEGGDASDLDAALRSARRVLAKEEAEGERGERERRARILALADGRKPDEVAREWARLRKEQDAAYRRWSERRPDERTARKAHLSNRLDGRARRMLDLADIYETLTGKPLG